MRIHVPSLPWTETTKDYLSCAYTQKVVKFCQMMDSLGHEVILYAGEDNEAPCTEHHVVVTKDEQKEWFGTNDPVSISMSPGITWDTHSVPWATMNSRVGALLAGGDQTDIIGLISGGCQYPICAVRPDMTVAEWGVGYQGVVPRDRWGWCFESAPWQHYVYFKMGVVNGRWYDTVIPNSFDPDDFQFSEKKGDYLLFLGRMVERKGPHIGAAIAERLGMRYVVAGPGGMVDKDGMIHAEGVKFKGEYVGPADIELRKSLLANAAAMIAPTVYIEPFGGVAVEAMLSGTPVVATPWGGFMDTVIPGVSGYHFNTLPEGAEAVVAAMDLDRTKVREYADRYSIWNIKHDYDRWLKQLDGLWADGRGVGDWNGDGAA